MRSNGKQPARLLLSLIFLWAASFLAIAPVCSQSIDETYKQAVKEGGVLNVYGTLTPDTAQKVLPLFEKRFPGIKTVNTGASSDKIVAPRSRKRAAAARSATYFT